MDIPFNAEVECRDGEIGRSTHVVYDPETRQITHLVIKVGLLGDEHLVPMQLVLKTTGSPE